ncbi:MAG TPA: glycerophosphodiester phosphodiesterase [Bryobacteraceae bacterium]|nr:glycerophosphodiester phosphodiesterase [Bryobacteraceae bacterium]
MALHATTVFRIVAILSLMAAGTLAANRILVHGHRGARAVRPENTLPAFEYAIQTGVDALELDVAVTKDNVLVVSHDPVLHAPVCSGPRDGAVIRELTFQQVLEFDCGSHKNPLFPRQEPAPGTRIPSLDEVFALASRGGFDYNVETKSFPDHPEFTPPPEEFSRMLLEAIRKRKLEKRVIVQSFDFRTLLAMKRMAPEIRLAALVENDPRDFVTIAREAQAAIISPHYNLVTPEKVRQAHAAGLMVVPWTANAPAQWDRLVAAGVDAIISDDPAELIAYLKRRGLH